MKFIVRRLFFFYPLFSFGREFGFGNDLFLAVHEIDIFYLMTEYVKEMAGFLLRLVILYVKPKIIPCKILFLVSFHQMYKNNRFLVSLINFTKW